MAILKKLYNLFLIIIIFWCSSCKKDKVDPVYIDLSKLENKTWYQPYGSGTINYKFLHDKELYLMHDYNFAINGGVNYKWKAKQDTLILLVGIITFTEFEKWKVLTLNDTILKVSVDSNIRILKTTKS